MDIRLNRKKYNIKTSANLTVKEYYELAKLELDKNRELNIMDYIAVVTGCKIHSIARKRVKQKSIEKISTYVGSTIPVYDFRRAENHIKTIYFESKQYTSNKIEWRTYGVRTAWEMQLKKYQNKDIYLVFEVEGEKKQVIKPTILIEMIVKFTAILLASDSDYDHNIVEENYKELLSCNYIDILGFGSFFFIKSKAGLVSGKSLFKNLWNIQKTSTHKK
jgi:hypothetical protein